MPPVAVVVPPVALLPLVVVVPPIGVVVPPDTLLPLAVVMPPIAVVVLPVAVVVPPVALLPHDVAVPPLAIVVPQYCGSIYYQNSHIIVFLSLSYITTYYNELSTTFAML